MNFFARRSQWPQAILAVLPFTLFFPLGFMYTGVVAFIIAYLLAGDFATRWRHVKESPLRWPVLALSVVSVGAGIFLERPPSEFWTDLVHYQIFVFLLFFASIGPGAWQRRAVKTFFAGATVAATLFYLNYLGVLPNVGFFRSYVIYSGNKSILLGVLLGIASAWMLFQLSEQPARPVNWPRLLQFLYVAAAGLLLGKTRTGSLIFVMLCMLIGARHLHLSWRNVLGVLAVGVLLTLLLAQASGLRQRVDNTVADIGAFSEGKQTSEQGIRLAMYGVTLQIIAEKPLQGHGVGTWLQQYRARTVGNPINIQLTPHNDYMLYMSEIGLFGMLALVWILLGLLVHAWRTGGERGMWLGMLTLSLMLGAMFNAMIRDGVFGMAFMILLAIPLAGALPARVGQQPRVPD